MGYKRGESKSDWGSLTMAEGLFLIKNETCTKGCLFN